VNGREAPVSTWIGSDSQYLYNLDSFTEIGVERRQDGLLLIKAWSESAVIGPNGQRFPRGESVTLAELTTSEDLEDALRYLRRNVCRVDFQSWDGSP
jgi:hypothetical protein